MQDCTFLYTCLVSDRPTCQDPFGSIDNLCGNLHQDHHSVDPFLSLIKSILVLSSKSLLPSHNNAKVVNFFHPDFSTPSRRAASLGWEKGLMHYRTIPVNPTTLLSRGNSTSSKLRNIGRSASLLRETPTRHKCDVTSNLTLWYNSYGRTLRKKEPNFNGL
jgi:hypothetical protein